MPTTTEDTEITLGTGKMLALFFGLVALCAVFFGMGYKLGKNSVTVPAGESSATTPAVSNPAARPSAVKSANNAGAAPAADVAFYKSGGPNPAAGSSAAQDSASTPSSANPSSDTGASDGKAAADASAAPSANAYYVQVAAVSKQEDGDALVDALKKKQYPAFATSGADKLFHVQVGPFADIKTAEDMRAKLVSDGYNPILKK